MKFTEVRLPSNKTFGFFFACLFLILSIFFYIETSTIAMRAFALTSAIFFVITLVKADLLLPLNMFWMRFGLLIGVIVSPVVLGIIFFGLFTPIALIMRLCKRDELRIKFMIKSTHWISRGDPVPGTSFKHQF